MTYIVKAVTANNGCNGDSCRVCEMYIPEFFSTNGGLTVVSENAAIDAAVDAMKQCPRGCIEMEVYRGEG